MYSTNRMCRGAAALLLAAALGACGGADPEVDDSTARDAEALTAGNTERDTSALVARPGPHNTGVPAATTLTPRKGMLTLSRPGQILDAVDLEGCVAVKAPGVIIRRSRIRCDSYYPVEVFDGADLVIEDSEIDGSPARGIATSGIAFSRYTARRVNIHGTADGLKADSDVIVEDSWIHDLWLGPDDHADGVQGTGGGRVTLRRNFVDIRDHGLGHGGEPNSAVQLGTEWASNSNWTIKSNWFYGGGWIVHVDAGNGRDNKIVKNRFGPAGYGPISTTGQWQVFGNVWDKTGEPI
jgi:hypothetical protein